MKNSSRMIYVRGGWLGVSEIVKNLFLPIEYDKKINLVHCSMSYTEIYARRNKKCTFDLYYKF